MIVVIRSENYGKPGQLACEATGSSVGDTTVKAQQSPPGARSSPGGFPPTAGGKQHL